jgi:Holliday junction resolvase RusA-like endonuclease
MTTEIQFVVPGSPVGKGRPKFARRGNFVTAYTPEKTASYENLVKVKAEESMVGLQLIEGAVSVEIRLHVTVPESWSQKKKNAALAHQIMPTSKPDADNCIKGIFDAMNGIVWNDDKQVTDLHVIKRYSEKPCAVVFVSQIDLKVA